MNWTGLIGQGFFTFLLSVKKKEEDYRIHSTGLQQAIIYIVNESTFVF